MMKAMKICRLVMTMLALFVIVSCSSDPEWADPEAHEKTEQLQKEYGPLLVGTWHCEYTNESQRYYEQLTFQEDGTLTGYRKWQTRKLVTIDGEQQYTDWETMESLVGHFTGRWKLEWVRNGSGVGENRISLYAKFDDEEKTSLAYSHNVLFVLFEYCGETTFRITGFQDHDDDGWTSYQRGAAEPSF